MGNGIGWTYVSTGKTGNAVINMFDYTESFFFIQLKNLGRADVYTQLTPAARLFVDRNF
jgi:hypothetical protein